MFLHSDKTWVFHQTERAPGPIYIILVYNYPPKGRWIVVDIYRDAKRRGIYPPLFTDPETAIRLVRHWINRHVYVAGVSWVLLCTRNLKNDDTLDKRACGKKNTQPINTLCSEKSAINKLNSPSQGKSRFSK